VVAAIPNASTEKNGCIIFPPQNITVAVIAEWSILAFLENSTTLFGISKSTFSLVWPNPEYGILVKSLFMYKFLPKDLTV